MVRYHEGGRFCEKDEDWDRESAIFHLEHAADLGELEAIVGLGLLYSQLPHHILADVALKVRGWDQRRPPQPTFPSLGSDHRVEPPLLSESGSPAWGLSGRGQTHFQAGAAGVMGEAGETGGNK